jgi:hypothetical protein
MSKHLAAVAGVVVAACALPVGNAAGATLSANVSILRSMAGTEARPAAERLHVALGLDGPAPITGFEVWTGPGLAWDRGHFAECRLSVLDREGPGGCPDGTILYRGIADLGPRPRVMFVNGPGRRPVAYVMLQESARVRAVVVPTVTETSRGAYRHRIAWTFRSTLRTAAPEPVTTSQLSIALGGVPASKYYLSSTSCPAGGWAWQVRVHTTTETLRQEGRVACRR